MRKTLILLPLLLSATPAIAQPAPQLIDPSIARSFANSAHAISDAVLDINVGQLQAAIEGRPATRAERHRTVRDLARRDDPDFDRKLHREIGQAGPVAEQGIRAVNEALPSIMDSVGRIQESIERAAANMPDPSYPRR